MGSSAVAVDIDALLAEDMGRFYADPLGFVRYAYEWGRGDLRGFEGPDDWQADLLAEVGEKAGARRFDGMHAVAPIRLATTSGHGIGKSALTAWLVNWIMSTRPYCKGVVTANTAPQLETKTWAEIAKWTKRSITGHWFEVAAGRGSMKMCHRDYPESWRVDAQTCREENSESFAGLHAANSTPFYIFDEASAVPDAIWQVAEGGLTDGEPMFFVFGNPTRNSGAFFRCFNAQKHRWSTRKIDSRLARITNKQQIAEWEQDYGEDSDFFRVRVKGEFPRAGSNQFISSEVVLAALARELEPRVFAPYPRYLGVDVARFGDDESVIIRRQGPKVFAPKGMRGVDTMMLVGHVLDEVREFSPVAVFVDGTGLGGGVVDRLRELMVPVVDVQFAASAVDSKQYTNMRAELWGRLRDWAPTADLPAQQGFMEELTAPEYGFNSRMQIQLERKEDMKKRGLASPDRSDALAVTFADYEAARTLVRASTTIPVRRFGA